MLMNTETMRFNASELCSRKLWQLVNEEDEYTINEIELREAVQELASRRHYLAELKRLGILEGLHADS